MSLIPNPDDVKAALLMALPGKPAGTYFIEDCPHSIVKLSRTDTGYHATYDNGFCNPMHFDFKPHEIERNQLT